MIIINKNKRSKARLKLGLVLGIFVLSFGLVITSMALGPGQGDSEELKRLREQVATQKGDLNKQVRENQTLIESNQKLKEEKGDLEEQLAGAAQSSGGGADVELWKLQYEQCLAGRQDLESENRNLRQSLEACRSQIR